MLIYKSQKSVMMNSMLKMIEAFQLLFLLVPPPNRMLLQQLLELLNLVFKNPHNKMTAHNLAVVFSPNIMGFKEKVTCLSHIPEDMTVMHKLVASMIHHSSDLFKIPKGLLGEIEAAEECFKKEELPVTHVFCQQMNQTSHRQAVQETTTDALVQLYNHVADLPDGPVRQKFLQRFEKMHRGTPPFIPRSKKASCVKQFASSTPLNSAESPAVKLTRTPLSPIPGRNTPVTSTPALKRRVAFDVVDSSDCFTPEMPVYRGTPFLSRFGFKTPSGVIHAGDSPSAKHKRTKSTSHQKEFVSPRKHVRRCSAHASSKGRLPSTTDTPFTPSGLMCSVTQADDSCEAESLVFTPSVKTRRATPPHLSQKLSAVDHSIDEIYV